MGYDVLPCATIINWNINGKTGWDMTGMWDIVVIYPLIN